MQRLVHLLILLLFAAPASAQQFPNKPINMIVVFAPGVSARSWRLRHSDCVLTTGCGATLRMFAVDRE